MWVQLNDRSWRKFSQRRFYVRGDRWSGQLGRHFRRLKTPPPILTPIFHLLRLFRLTCFSFFSPTPKGSSCIKRKTHWTCERLWKDVMLALEMAGKRTIYTYISAQPWSNFVSEKELVTAPCSKITRFIETTHTTIETCSPCLHMTKFREDNDGVLLCEETTVVSWVSSGKNMTLEHCWPKVTSRKRCVLDKSLNRIRCGWL